MNTRRCLSVIIRNTERESERGRERDRERERGREREGKRYSDIEGRMQAGSHTWWRCVTNKRLRAYQENGDRIDGVAGGVQAGCAGASPAPSFC
jgi:hypothetical protein